MSAQQLNIDNIANNLANANTTGFKHRRAQFQDLLYQTSLAPGTAAGQQTVVPTGLQVGLGARPVSNEIIFAQGDFIQTGNPLDLVIQGQGFFQIRQPDGTLAYTRAGAFHIDRDGNIVDANGNPTEPQVTLPKDALSVTVAADGTVSFTQPGQITAQQGGAFQLALFPNPSGLNSLGNNLFQPTQASGDPVVGSPGGLEGNGPLLQGSLEGSNVSVVEEFINMIISQRAYEASSKVVQAADQMYQEANNITR
jgi:flagellar basal-body rod protein FlgG